MNSFLTRVIACAALVALAFSAGAEQVAFTGATLHPVDGEPVENGVLLVEDGRIAAVGRDVEVPADARRVDLSGRHVYPGMIHAGTVLGLTEIGSVPGTEDYSEMGQVNAAIRAETAFNADSMLLAPNVTNGLLTAHVMPVGGLIRGTSAVMRLDGWNFEDMSLLAPAGMHIAFPAAAVDDSDNEELKLIDSMLDEARAWASAAEAASDSESARPAANDQLAALEPLVSGDMRLFVHASGESAMNAALDWIEKQEFEDVVLVGGPDLQHVAERLADAGMDAILTGVQVMPERRWEPYDAAYVAPAVLAEAGVRFAITDGGSAFVAGNARNIPFHAGMATGFGLSHADALKSVTLWPAEILGVGDELGSLAAGKRATFFVADGSPLDEMTEVFGAWIDGREYDFVRDRQRRLYQRYSNRPQPAGAN